MPDPTAPPVRETLDRLNAAIRPTSDPTTADAEDRRALARRRIARGAQAEHTRLTVLADDVDAVDAACVAMLGVPAHASPWEQAQAAVRAFLDVTRPAEAVAVLDQNPGRITRAVGGPIPAPVPLIPLASTSDWADTCPNTRNGVPCRECRRKTPTGARQ